MRNASSRTTKGKPVSETSARATASKKKVASGSRSGATTRKSQTRTRASAASKTRPAAAKTSTATRKNSAGSRPAIAARKSATAPTKNTVASNTRNIASVQKRRQSAGRRGTTARTDAAKSAVARTEPAYFVLVPTAALLLLGLVMVFSAGSIIGMGQSIGGYRYFLQQLAWAGLGLVLLVFFWKFDYHKLGKISVVGVAASIVLLGLVLYKGRSAYGATRWLVLGPVNIQPTEIAKFTLVIFAAFVLATKGDKVKQIFHVLVPVLVIAVLEAGLILKQPDMGSALVLLFSIMVLLVVARTRGRHLAVIGATGAAAAMYFALSAPYRRARLFSFINPWNAPRGAGYQVIQSYIALGTGSVKGIGLGMSRQKFLYLPNAHTDFIFAIIGEELGLLGTVTVLVLVGLLAYGGLRIAGRAPDEMGKLLAAGITALIVIQALVNMGGVTGLLPITGVPLPLISSGGSSLCICMGCIGILLNIAAQSYR